MLNQKISFTFDLQRFASTQFNIATGNTVLSSSAVSLSASQIQAGTLPATRGGTGQTDLSKVTVGTATSANSATTATTASSLTTARSLQVSLNKTSATNFQGNANVTNIGVQGILGTVNGGTGAAVNPSMLTNLGSTIAANVFAASPRPGVTGTLDIANGGTGATTEVGIYNNVKAGCTCVQYQIATNTNPWHKVADITLNSDWSDATLVLLVTNCVGSSKVGILQIHVATNATVPHIANISWLLNDEFDVSKFRLEKPTDRSLPWIIWHNVSGTNVGTRFTVLDCSSNRSQKTMGWTLYDNLAGGTTSTEPTGDNIIVSTNNIYATSADSANTATTAASLTTARALQVSLNKTSSTNFQGNANVTNIGVQGVLSVANGGTGQSVLSSVTVGKANTLTTARALQVSLSNTGAPTFNGTADVKTIGVQGILSVANGGTGISVNPSMLTNLGTTVAANVLAASPRPGVTGTLPVANGGTGATVLSAITVGKANSLTTARALQVSLSNTSAPTFNGTADVKTIGVQGVLSTANGGTGLTVNPSMLTNLGSTAAANVFAASPRPGVTGTLPVANGGTGQTDLSAVKGVGSALEFNAAQNVSLSGAVTGYASSKAGWNIVTQKRTALVGLTGTSLTAPWFKVASIDMGTSNNDFGISFYVEDLYLPYGYRSGICRVHIRAASGVPSVSSTNCGIFWSYNTRIPLDHVVLVLPNGTTGTAEVWTKTNYKYLHRRFTVISEGIRTDVNNNSLWTLYHTSASAGQATPGLGDDTQVTIESSVGESNNFVNGITGTDATFSGTLMLTGRTDLSGTEYTSPPLVVGGTATQTHMEFDTNEIQAKKNASVTTALHINTDGGDVVIGEGVLSVKGSIKSMNDITVSGTAQAAAFSGPLTGNVTGNVSGSSGSCTGNALTASSLQTARSLQVSLSKTSATNFQGNANVTNIGVQGVLPVANGGTGATTELGIHETIKRGNTFIFYRDGNSTNKYFKVVDINTNAGIWTDLTLLFTVQSCARQHGSGILVIHIATNETTVDVNSIYWLCLNDSGIDPSNLKLHVPATPLTEPLSLWLHVPSQNTGLRFTLLDYSSTRTSKSSSKLTFYENLVDGNASSFPTTGTLYDSQLHPVQEANQLVTARTIDGVNFNGSAAISHYGVCSTAAGTTAKAVACAGYVLTTGSMITVRFANTNTKANPTLNVNSTGAKAIYYRGAAIPAAALQANSTYTFVYNGTQYEIVGSIVWTD